MINYINFMGCLSLALLLASFLVQVAIVQVIHILNNKLFDYSNIINSSTKVILNCTIIILILVILKV